MRKRRRKRVPRLVFNVRPKLSEAPVVDTNATGGHRDDGYCHFMHTTVTLKLRIGTLTGVYAYPINLEYLYENNPLVFRTKRLVRTRLFIGCTHIPAAILPNDRWPGYALERSQLLYLNITRKHWPRLRRQMLRFLSKNNITLSS